MKPTRRSRSGLVAAAIGAPLAALGWWILSDEAFVLDADRPAPFAAASGSTQRPAPPQRLAPGPPSDGANVADLLGSSAFAASASGPASAAPAPEAIEPQPAAPAGRDRRSALAALDTDLVQQRVLPAAATRAAFAAKSWFVAPPPPPPAPPPPPPAPAPPPLAPPLPFKYIGMLEESAERTVWYLVQGERLIVVATGEVIDASYRVDGSRGRQLQFTYLPLDQRQTLAIGDSP